MADGGPRSWIGGRLVEWARRYAPLEIVSMLSALSGAFLASQVTDRDVAVAYAGAWAENVGYYGCAFAREMRWIGRAYPDVADRVLPWPQRSLAAVKALVWEFGAAEVLDSLVVRPLCMYAAVAISGHLGLGIVIGKLAGDVIFYGIAILFYEWGKKRRGGHT